MNEDEDEDTQICNYQINNQMMQEEVKEAKEEEVQCVEYPVIRRPKLTDAYPNYKISHTGLEDEWLILHIDMIKQALPYLNLIASFGTKTRAWGNRLDGYTGIQHCWVQ